MQEQIREIAAREAIAKHQEIIGDAQNLIKDTSEKMSNIEATPYDEWKSIKTDIERNILTMEGLQEMEMLNDEQKKILTKLNTQKEYIENDVLPYFEKQSPEKTPA